MSRIPPGSGRFTKPTIQWNGKAFQRVLREDLIRGLTLATQLLRKKVVREISKSAITKAGAVSPSKGGRSPRVLTHSRPGKPPRAISGKLRQSIFASVNKADASNVESMFGAVGTKLDYGVGLELGTRKTFTIRPKRKKALVFGVNGVWVFTKRVRRGPIAKRPYIVVTMKKNQRQISAGIFGPLRRRLGGGRLQFGR